jgi:hypothetical protein
MCQSSYQLYSLYYIYIYKRMHIHIIKLIIKLACEYRTGFQARNVEYKTVLCPHAELFKILIIH